MRRSDSTSLRFQVASGLDLKSLASWASNGGWFFGFRVAFPWLPDAYQIRTGTTPIESLPDMTPLPSAPLPILPTLALRIFLMTHKFKCHSELRPGIASNLQSSGDDFSPT